jgi:hypothetical protein
VNAVAYIAFAIIFLICTVVFLGFVLVGWLGWVLGLLWMAVATAFVVFILWQLYRYTSSGNTEIPGDGEGSRR